MDPGLGRALACCVGNVGNGLSWGILVGEGGAIRGRSRAGISQIDSHSSPRSTYGPAAWLPAHHHLVPSAHPVDLAAAAVVVVVAAAAGDIAGRSHSPGKVLSSAAVSAAGHSCRHSLVGGRGPSHRHDCYIRRPIARTDHVDRSHSRRTVAAAADRTERRSPPAASPAAGHLGYTAVAVAAAADTRRSSAAVAAAVGMPLAQPHNARRI